VSESTDSLHLVDRDEAQAVESLRNAGVRGLVLPRRGRHTTLLVPRQEQSTWLSSTPGLIVRYQFAADHGLRVRLYQGGHVLSELRRDFERPVPPRFDPAPWLAHGLLDDAAAAEALERRLAQPWPDRNRRHWVAERLGLLDVDWVSGDDVLQRMESLQERFPEARLVGGEVHELHPPAGRGVVLCALSEARRAMIEIEPDLARELLEARHTQPIRGLLDLGPAGLDLVRHLSLALPEIAEALPLSLPMSYLEPQEVIRLALVLRAAEGIEVREGGQAFEALVNHYAEAAERGEAMLVLLEQDS
jgi:hypothetical protein